MPNPFEAATNPTSGFQNMMGTLGSAFGVPSQQERVGGLQANAMKTLAELRTKGLSPDKALLEFVNTPEGQELFMGDPSGLKMAADFLTQSTPAQPTITNTPAGATARSIGPGGKITELGTTPTTDVQNQAAVGGVRQAAAAWLTQSRLHGDDPQKTWIDFGNSTEGKNLFLTDPQGHDFAKGILAGTVAPPPQINSIAPGAIQTSTDQNGVTKPGIRNPTEKVQTTQEFASLAQMPADKLTKVYEAQLMGQPSEQKQAVDDLIQNHGLPTDVGAKIMAGVLKITPIHDQYGANKGNAVIDMSNGGAVTQLPGASTSTAGATPGGAQQGLLPWPVNNPPPQVKNPDGTIKPGAVFNDKANMFLGSGVAPMVVSTLSTMLSMVDPTFAFKKGMEVDAQRQNLKELHSAIVSIREGGSSLGISNRVLAKVEGLVPGLGPFVGIPESIQKGIQLYDLVQSELHANEATIADPNSSNQVRVEANRRIEGWRRVQRALPTRESMEQIQSSVAQGTAGAIGAKELISTVGELATKGKEQASDLTGANKLNIAAMGAKDLLKLDPAKLDPAGRQQLQLRLKKILGK